MIGLAGVALVVWHKIDIREVTLGCLAGTLIALAGVTAATLYQRKFSPKADLKAASVVQFAASLAVLAPLAVGIEGFAARHSVPMWLSIVFLVIFASILAVNALHVLMRHGEATRVASMMYLPPVFAVGLEAVMFALVPSGLAAAGILLTCAGVAMTVWTRRRPALQADRREGK
jgi:drug/metabolite transporter (DMT)-like permease